MKTLRDAFLIGWLKSVPDLRRQPLLVVLIVMISAFPLVFFAALGSAGMLGYGIVGALLGTLCFFALNAPVQELGFDRYVRLREMMIAMPVRPIAYAMGVALAALIVSLPGVIFYFVITGVYGLLGMISALWVVLALTLVWTCVSTLSFAVSGYLTKATTQTLNNVSNLLGLGLVFIPPVYYPASRLGGFSWISVLIPTSNAASIIQSYTGLSVLSSTDLLLRWAVLAGMTVGFLAIATVKARWREK